MTPNDAQIDVLLRRHAKKAVPIAAGVDAETAGHLDADELNALAEGVISTAARTRYISHLSICDHCRQLATELTLASGRAVLLEAEAAAPVAGGASLWKALRNLLAPARLRYAAFALVVIAAGGITFVALRRHAEDRGPALVAQNEQAPADRSSALKTVDNGLPQSQPAQIPQSASQNANGARPQSSQPGLAGNTSPAAAQPTAEPRLDLATTEKQKTENEVAEVKPAYAPPPPGERDAPARLEEKRSKDLRAATAPPPAPKAAADNFKVMERPGQGAENPPPRETETVRVREGALSKEEAKTVNQSQASQPESSATRRTEENRSPAGPADEIRRGLANVTNATPQDRRAGGHTFRKQGGAWVDLKFKSSMQVITVARASDEFRALDSSVRALANQFSGEVIIVHKGKAYRIR
jgi:hypothetical protein